MAKQNPLDLLEQLKKDEKSFDGSGTISSHAPDPDSDDDTSEALEDVIGNPPKPRFNIGKEVNKDEQRLRIAEGVDEPVEVPASAAGLDEEAEGKLAGVSESTASSTQDPFDLLSDADFKKKSS